MRRVSPDEMQKAAMSVLYSIFAWVRVEVGSRDPVTTWPLVAKRPYWKHHPEMHFVLQPCGHVRDIPAQPRVPRFSPPSARDRDARRARARADGRTERASTPPQL